MNIIRKINMPFAILLVNKFNMPVELVDIILDFNNYEKYYKPAHKENFKITMEDIRDMGTIFAGTITPRLAKECWGTGNGSEDESEIYEYDYEEEPEWYDYEFDSEEEYNFNDMEL